MVTYPIRSDFRMGLLVSEDILEGFQMLSEGGGSVRKEQLTEAAV